MTEWARAVLRAALIALIALAPLVGGCGGQAGQFDGTVYQNGYTRYSVGPLPGWRRVTDTDSNLAFQRQGMGVIGVHSTCEDYDDVPSSALVNHLLFGTENRKYVVDEEAPVDGRGARHVLVEASLDGVPIELEAYVLVRDGCVYDLTHARPAGDEDPGRAQFLGFVQQFRVLPWVPQ